MDPAINLALKIIQEKKSGISSFFHLQQGIQVVFSGPPSQIASSEPSGHRLPHTHAVSASNRFNLGVLGVYRGQRQTGCLRDPVQRES